LYEVKRDIAQKDIKDTEAKIKNLTTQQRSFYGISEEQEQTLDELRKQLANQRVDYEVEAINRMNALNAARVELQTRFENIGLNSRQLTEKEMDASFKRETESLLAKGATEEELYKLDAIYEDKKNALHRQYEAEDQAAVNAANEKRKAASLARKDAEAKILAEQAKIKEDALRLEIEQERNAQAELQRILTEMDAAEQLAFENQLKRDREEVESERAANAEIDRMTAEMDADQAAQEQAEIERKKKNQENTLSVASSGLNALSQLTEAFAGKSKKQQERAFKINKAINIASALIDTYKSATAALATYPPPFGAIAAGASIAVGLANVAKIKAQQFNGGGGGGGSVSVGSGGGSSLGGGGSNAAAGNPTFNPLNTAFLQNRPPQPAQAYVIAGNVSNAQDANAKIKNLARLG
jgi:chemotaxis protein histidine kinase CheA